VQEIVNRLGNEYDYKCKGFELKAVPRSEFEALKRFGDYTELQDGTLMWLEGDMEFRIYCEDVEGCPIGIVTEGVLNLFADLCDDAPREADATSEQWESLPDNSIPMPAERMTNRPGKRLRDEKMLLPIWLSSYRLSISAGQVVGADDAA
jgi:hypothetical protein